MTPMPKLPARRYTLTAAIVALLIVSHYLKIISPLEYYAVNMLKPVFAGLYSAGSVLRIAYNQQMNKDDLLGKIKEVQNKYNELTAENARLKVLEEENQALRQQLKFLSTNQYSYVMANIISRGSLDSAIKNSQTIIINKGSSDGLYPGLPVVSPGLANADRQGIIIGKIISVKDNISEAVLLTNQNCKLTVSIENQNKTSGLTRGDLGLTIKMEFIPQTEIIKNGDNVITSGLEKNIPRGLVVGKVSQVVKENNELWQNAVVDPLIDFDDLTIVSVLLP